MLTKEQLQQFHPPVEGLVGDEKWTWVMYDDVRDVFHTFLFLLPDYIKLLDEVGIGLDTTDDPDAKQFLEAMFRSYMTIITTLSDHLDRAREARGELYIRAEESVTPEQWEALAKQAEAAGLIPSNTEN